MNETQQTGHTLRKAGIGLLLGCVIWLPLLHRIFDAKVHDYFATTGVGTEAQAIAAQQRFLWTNEEARAAEIKRMRASNAEWDFMGRTFLVLSFANLALHEPEREDAYLAIIDTIIDETLQRERGSGMYHFLMDYAQAGAFKGSGRSIFQDGEIAMMLAARRLVREHEPYRPLLDERVAHIVESLRAGPVLCGESYPDECWTFCNAIAVSALRMSDAAGDGDHSALITQWLQRARSELMHQETGLLISSFTLDGRAMDGPEGSSIWMVAHCLSLLDPDFARDQYERAKQELARSALGFGYAKEWPSTWNGPMDIDSGPIVPLLEISAGSSGLAFLGAATFEDKAYLKRLLRSLRFGGFPIRDDGRTRFAASNQVGDAVMLYAMVQGPLWQRVQESGR